MGEVNTIYRYIKSLLAFHAYLLAAAKSVPRPSPQQGHVAVSGNDF